MQGDVLLGLQDILPEIEDRQMILATAVIRAAIAEISALRAAQVGAGDGAGWQPIETTDRDHFPRLVWSPERGQCVAFLDATWKWWPVPATKPLPSPPHFWKPLPSSPVRARVGTGEDQAKAPA